MQLSLRQQRSELSEAKEKESILFKGGPFGFHLQVL